MFLSLTTTEKTRGRGMSPPCGSMLNQNKCQTKLRMAKERLCWNDSVDVVFAEGLDHIISTTQTPNVL